MADFASLGIRIETGQVKKGTDALDDLAAAGKKAEAATDALAQSTKDVGAAASSAASGVAKVAAETKKQAQAATEAAKATSAQAASAKAVQNSIVASASAAGRGATNFNALASSQKLTAMQAQQLSYQLNDLFVQISSGQSPLMALIQQGSQLNGTFGGLGGTLRAVGSLFTTTRVLIGGTLAAVGALALAFNEGNSESAKLARTLALTGNAAGITEGQFNSLAASISDATNTTIGSTRDTLQLLVGTGKFSGDALAQAAKAAQGLSKATGQSAEDVVKSFASMSGGVAKWATETNSQYHFLTAAQLEYIKTLEDQGREQEAIATAMAALNGRIGEASQNLGILERAWGGVKNAASAAVDAMLQIGRVETPEAKLADLNKQLSFLNTNGGSAARKQDLQEQIAGQTEVVRLGQRSATIAAENAQREQARAQFNKLTEQSMTRQEIRAKEIAKANALADRAGVSAEQRAKLIANINEKYKDPKGPKPKKEPSTVGAQLAFDLEDIRTAQEALINTIANGEKVLEARRSANLVTEEAYWEQKRTFLVENSTLQEQGLQKELDRLKQESLTGKEKIDNDRKILDVEGKLAKVRQDAAANLEVLSIRQTDALDKIRIKYEQAEAAAQSYVDTIARQNERELNGLGRGNQNREIDARRNQREDQFQARKEQLESQRRANQITSEEYERFLAIEQSAHERSLANDEQYWRKKLEIQGDGIKGAQEGLQNYIDEVNNSFERGNRLVTDGLQGITSSLTDAVWDRDLKSAKDFGDRIGKQILSGIFEQQFTKPLAEWLQGSLKDSDSIVSKLLGGLTGTKGSGENWLGALGLGGGASSTGAASAAASTAALASGATVATTALTSLAAAASAAAASMGGSSITSGLGGLFGGGGGGGEGDALGALIALNGWAEGGYTGPGAKYQPAGIVHAGEYVVNAENTRRLGLSFLERLNRRGYADGGFVGSVMGGNLAGGGETTNNSRLEVHNHFAAGTDSKTVDQAALKFYRQLQRSQRDA